jgi:hypothetical protein
VSSVSKNPGATALTVMPSRPKDPVLAMIEDMLTIRPGAFIHHATHCVLRKYDRGERVELNKLFDARFRHGGQDPSVPSPALLINP